MAQMNNFANRKKKKFMAKNKVHGKRKKMYKMSENLTHNSNTPYFGNS